MRCDRFQPDLSAFADGTLPHKRWEQVSYHLAGCQACRDEVAAISNVCSTLSESCRRSSTPDSLAARLESIAGDAAAAPLYMAAGRGELPSARRQRQRRMAQGSAALLVMALSVIVIAVLVAPEPRRLTDPIGTARQQFSMSTAAVSVNEALGAVLLAHERGADLGEAVSYQRLESDTLDVVISPKRAAAWLRDASDTDLTLRGVQRVWVADADGGYRTADVRTVKVAGHGAQLDVFDARGDRFNSSFLPDFHLRQVEATERWNFTESFRPQFVSGRDAYLIKAHDDYGTVAGWWIDSETGLLLWSERYNPSGEVVLAFGYTELESGAASFAADDSGFSQMISLEPASSSQEKGWCVGIEHCPQSVAGLPLVAHSSSTQRDGDSMTLVYSDGFSTAVVNWTPGVLEDGVTARSDRASGLPTVHSWQCDEAVITVVSDAPSDLISEIADDLPAEQPHTRTLLERAAEGFGRLLGVS